MSREARPRQPLPGREHATAEPPHNVLLLVECGATAGLGHLRRMSVLAQALRERGAACVFGLTDEDCFRRVRELGFPARPWDPSTGDIVLGFDAVVLDGYAFDAAQLSSWRGRLTRMVVDDTADRPVDADIVLNHNLYGDLCDYSAYRTERVLAGPRYSLVGRAFREIGSTPRPARPRALISFGGTDDGRFAVPMARSLLVECPGLPIDVALLAPAPAAERELNVLGVTTHVNQPLERLMAEATVYVGGGGFTVIEAFVAGLAVVACRISANQRMNVEAAAAIGISAFPSFEPESMARAVAGLLEREGVPPTPSPVDGLGASRVAVELMGAIGVRGAAEPVRGLGT